MPNTNTPLKKGNSKTKQELLEREGISHGTIVIIAFIDIALLIALTLVFNMILDCFI